MGLPEQILKQQIASIEKDLKKIDRQAYSKVLKPAMKKAVKPIQKQAKANAKWPSIKKLIKTKVQKGKNGILGKIFVAPDKSGRKIQIEGRNVGFEVVANILEFGRAAPFNAGGIKVVKPVAFMRNAEAQKKTEAFDVLRKEITKNLRKY